MEEQRRQNLIHLVDTFGIKNSNLKELKAECDARNQEIKTIMAEENLDYFNTEDYSASYKVKQTTKVNEEKLLQVLKKDWTSRNGSMECPYIQKREYVDSDALEAAIYKGEINPETLAMIKDCSTVVETPTLIVKKKGGK